MFADSAGGASDDDGFQGHSISARVGRIIADVLYNLRMSLTPEFIRAEIEKQTYQISLHADDERLADGLQIGELESALKDCQVIEQYPDDPRGESCLALGFVNESPFTSFVGKTALGVWS